MIRFPILISLLSVWAGGIGAAQTAEREGPTIRWEADSLRHVDRGGYGRALRLDGERLLLVYSLGGAIRLIRSEDGGDTWSRGRDLCRYEHGVSTNAEIIRHSSGRLLVAFNDRARAGSGAPFRIGLLTSDDTGETWSNPRTLFTGGAAWETGCWEPAMVELPGGALHMLFADESAFRDSADQAIAMMSSANAGETWSEPRPVIYAQGARDGMPVPRLRLGTEELWVAIESNGRTHRLTPEILRLVPTRVGRDRDRLDYWPPTPIPQSSPDRVSPILLPGQAYAGAPYLAFLGFGQTILLSCQENRQPEPGRESHHGAVAVVYAGDAGTLSFGPPSYPFSAFGNPETLWNSLTPVGERDVLLVTSGTVAGRPGIHLIRGSLVARP